MATMSDFETKVGSRLQDAANKLAIADRDDLIQQAIVERYSQDAPLIEVADQPGDGSTDVSLPTDYEDGFSVVREVEYPVGQIPASTIPNKDYGFYRTPSGLKLRLVLTAVNASETVRITYTARHADDGSTVRPADINAVADYAASLCFDALAASYVQVGDATIGADSVNYRTKSQEYTALSKRLAKRYFDHMGVEESATESTNRPAIAMGDLDESLPQGVDRLTHPRRDR